MIAAERPRGVLRRQLILGDTPDTDRVQASYTAGVLTLRIPVAEKAKPRKIIANAGPGRRPWPTHRLERHPMARHVVHRRNGQVDEYQELPDTEHLEPDMVTVTFPDGSLRSYHVEDGLGGVGFEFAASRNPGAPLRRQRPRAERLRAHRLDLGQRHRARRPRPTILQRPLRSTMETAAVRLARLTVAAGVRGRPQGNDMGPGHSNDAGDAQARSMTSHHPTKTAGRQCSDPGPGKESHGR